MIKQNVVKNLPNLLTLSNMTMGMIAIITAVNGSYFAASLFIVIGAVIDRYDGIAARKFNSTSEIGKEMDSLADMITFGVAPAVTALMFPLSQLNILGYIIAIIFVGCGLYRLSRFNITNSQNVYIGLPITMAGSLLALAFVYQHAFYVYPYITAVIMLIFSYLMVSQHQIKKV